MENVIKNFILNSSGDGKVSKDTKYIRKCAQNDAQEYLYLTECCSYRNIWGVGFEYFTQYKSYIHVD